MMKAPDVRCLLKAVATASRQASSATAGPASKPAIAQITAQRCIKILPIVAPLSRKLAAGAASYCAPGTFATHYVPFFPAGATL
jgi:hypothetical protein